MAFFGDCTNSQNGGTTSATVDSTFPAGTKAGMVFVGGIGTNSGVVTLNSLLGAATAGHDWSSAVILPAGALPKAGDSQAGNIETLLVVRVLTAQDIIDGFVRATLSASGRCYFQASIHDKVSGVFPTPPAVAKATASTLTAPTLTTTGNNSDVVMVVGTRNAALSTFPVPTIGTGFTTQGSSGTANAASANLGGGTGQLTTPVGVGVTVGGQTISATNTPTQLIAYAVELRASSAPNDNEKVRRPAPAGRRRTTQPPPVEQVVSPSRPTTRRRTIVVVRRTRGAQVIPTVVVVTAPSFIPQDVRHRIFAAFYRRHAGGTVIPAQVVTPPPFLPQDVRHRIVTAKTAKHSGAQHVPTQSQHQPPLVERRRPVSVPRRAHVTQVYPPITVVTTQALPASQVRHRVLVPARIQRHAGATFIPTQAVVTAPVFVPQALRHRVLAYLLRRHPGGTVVPAQAAVAPAFIPQTVRHRVLPALKPTRRRGDQRHAEHTRPPTQTTARRRNGSPRRRTQPFTPFPFVAPPLTPGQMSSALGPVPTMTAALAPGGMSSSQGTTPGMSSAASGSSAMSSAPGPTPSMAGS